MPLRARRALTVALLFLAACESPQEPQPFEPDVGPSKAVAAEKEPAPVPTITTVTLCKVGSDANFTVKSYPTSAAEARSLLEGECQLVFSSKKGPSKAVTIVELLSPGASVDSILVTSGGKDEVDDTTRYRNRSQLTVNPTARSLTVTFFNPPSTQPTGAWIGLKNSDDVGTRFDFLAEVLVNDVVMATTQLDNQASGSSGFNNALLRALSVSFDFATQVLPGDALSVRLSARIAEGVPGHRSGTARLWLGDGAANSGIDLVGTDVATFYLRSDLSLSTTVGVGPRTSIDVRVDRLDPGNPFRPFGTWTIGF